MCTLCLELYPEETTVNIFVVLFSIPNTMYIGINKFIQIINKTKQFYTALLQKGYIYAPEEVGIMNHWCNKAEILFL
jgi:hypothetical protein